ncbi:MAG: DHH family phosphoesterase [Bacilli bacterium]|nr:DHH family phosphoesterase [Bacilli bacterium]
MEELYSYFINNKKEMYKLIEIRNNDFQAYNNKDLKNIRKRLIERQIQKIIDLCVDKEVYILGHNNPDADSIISSYILANILKTMNIKSSFCILDHNYDYTFHDKKLLDDKFQYQPVILHDTDRYFILVDHNDLQGLPRDNVIGAFDHHIIKDEIDNIIEIEYASTSLLLYDLFKEKYSFNEEEKYLIALATLSDTEYLTSSRFTIYDKQIYDELKMNLNVKELQKKYFITTDFTLNIDKNFEMNKKEYIRNDKKITRILITSYDDKFLEDYINKAKQLNYLLMWVNYEDNTTTIYFNNKTIRLDYILSSTYLVFQLLGE